MITRALQAITHHKSLLSFLVGLITTIQAVAGGASVVGWGANTWRQSDVPAELTNVVTIAAGGSNSLALKKDGRVAAWGNPAAGLTNVPPIVTNVVAIASGIAHNLALRSNGTTVVWGSGSYGLIYGTYAISNAAAIAAGWYHNLALKSNGTVIAWGAGAVQSSFSPDFGQSMVPTNLTGVTTVAAGGYHSLALRSNGTVVAWGWNKYGQTNVPAGLSNVIAIAAGGSNSIALKADGTLVAWGNNTHGQTNVPAGLSNVVAIAAGAAHNLALKQDGTLVAWGLNGNGQTNVPAELTNITAIAAGAFHSLALLNIGPVTFPGSSTSLTALKGTDVALTMPVLGDGPLSYQWVRNGIPVPDGTNAALAIPNVQLSDAGNYQLVASNAFGAGSSPVLVLLVQDTAPFFTSHPVSRSVLQHSNATLSVSVGGIPPITCQWQFNGANIPGATNLALTVTNAQSANEGYYSVVASNAYGTATSSSAFLSVIDVPEALGATNLVWYNPPSLAWFVQSTNTHDGVAAVGAGPLPQYTSSFLQTYVTGPGTLSFWYRVPLSLPSSSASLSFSLDGLVRFTGASYDWTQYTVYLGPGLHTLGWMAANNSSPFGSGFVFLDDVVFTPGPSAPMLTSQPAGRTTAAGTSVTLSLGAGGTPSLSYQWYGNNLPIPGGTNSSLTLSNIQASDAGTYYAVVTNAWGRAQSANATLTVTPAAPTFTIQPVGAYLLLGGQATLSGTAIGSAPLSYQWLRNGVPLPNATNTTLAISPLQSADAGTYSLLASNWLGQVSSSNALVVVYALADLGTAVDNPSLAWSTTNMPWFSQTNTTHDGVSAAQSGFIADTQRSTLQTVVTGPATIAYWWKVNCDSFWTSLAFRLDGAVQNAIAGAVDWQQASNYVGAGSHVLQWDLYPPRNGFARGTGWVDQVQIIAGSTPVSITAQPSSQTHGAGNSVTFSVGATGTPPFRYQWRFNGADIPGATNATLALNNLQENNSGIYSAVVSNDVSFAVSSTATLAVNPSVPVITVQPASQSRALRSSVSFAVAAKGSAPFTYQWRCNGEDIPGATAATLSLTNLQFSDSGAYAAVVTNAFGAVTSAVARLEVSATRVVDYWPVPPAGYSAPSGLGTIQAIAVGRSHTVGLRPDGTVVSWGHAYYGLTNVPAGLSNVTAIAAGDYHTVALKADGTVVVWGDNSSGQLQVPANLSNVMAMAAGPNTTLALKSDGTVVGWGRNTHGQLDIPAGLTNVQAVAASAYNGFAIGADGTVTQWGNRPPWYQDGVDTPFAVAPGCSNVSAVAAGAYAAWSLHSDGSVRSWSLGFPGDQVYENIAAVAAGGPGTPSNDYLMALTYEGTVCPLETFSSDTWSLPAIPSGLSNVVGIAAAYYHAAVLINDGSPCVVGQPVSRMLPAGATVTISPGVVGAGPLGYQWRFNGSDIPDATNATLTLSNLGPQNAGAYNVLARNDFGVATGAVTRLSVHSAPQLTLQTAGEGFGFSGGHFGFDVSGPSGRAVVIETSTNLEAWVPLQTNVLVNGQVHFIDAQSGQPPRRFYRARLLEAAPSAPAAGVRQ